MASVDLPPANLLPTDRPFPAKLTTNDGRSTDGTFFIRELSVNDRIVIGLKWLGVFWGIALVCVLFPIIHFVLVPTFFLLGPILGFLAARGTRRIERGEASCPNCSKQILFMRTRYRDRIKDHCPHCLYEFYIEFPKSEALA